MKQTLWKLAQSWRTQAEAPDINPIQALELRACASQAEQWAREQAREIKAANARVGEYPNYLDDLGVPKEGE